MTIHISARHRLAEIVARMTFPTKRETARDYEDRIVVYDGGQPIAWRVFNPSVPERARALLMEKLIGE